LPKFLKVLKVMKLGHLKGSRVLPLGFSIALVRLNSMVVILWDLIALLVTWCHVVRPELGVIDHIEKFLFFSCNAFKPLLSIKIK